MAEPGFEDFEGLSPSQRFMRLKLINREHEEQLNRNGVLRIQSMHMPNRYWDVDHEDVENVMADASDGSLMRKGGFRETVYLLLMAGF